MQDIKDFKDILDKFIKERDDRIVKFNVEKTKVIQDSKGKYKTELQEIRKLFIDCQRESV